ncbi:MAG: hypothetical protein AABY22_26165 [Nanoarchaeota archaeon]
MLTLEQIAKLHEQGLQLTFRKRAEKYKIKGAYWERFNRLKPRIAIYAESVRNKKERDIVLLHEFIHARDDLIPRFRRMYKGEKRREEERRVDNEAYQTYIRRYYIINFIKRLYKTD